MFTPGTKLTKALKVMLAVDGKYEEALHIYAPYHDYSKDASRNSSVVSARAFQ
jgi:hypothetical protein